MKPKYSRSRSRDERSLWKGLAAGIAGGLVASWVMNHFQAFLSELIAGEDGSHGAQSMQKGSPQVGIGRELQARGKDDEQDDAAERLANAISVGVFDHELTKSEKDLAGTVFHYAMGVTSGGMYGVIAEAAPFVTFAHGMPFGVAVWLGADEGLVPALGLSKSSSEYPFSVHAYAFASHVIFGLTTEVVRSGVRSALDK